METLDKRRDTLLLLPLGVFLLTAFAIPAAALFARAFSGTAAEAFARVAGVWSHTVSRRALFHSIEISAIVAGVSIGLCLPVARLLALGRFRGKGLARAALSLPLLFSGVIVGFIAIVMLGYEGAIPALFRAVIHQPVGAGLAYAMPGLILAYLFFEIPRAVLSLESAFVELDSELLDAAGSLGAGPVHRLFRVTLPLLRPALAGTFAATFAVSLGSYGAALILSRRYLVLPVEIYRQFTGFSNDAAACAAAAWLIALSLAVTIVAARSERAPR